jgi:DNA-binding transcriptional MerR regulator
MKKLYTPKDLMEIFGKCRKTISRYEQQGLLKPIKVNSRVFLYDPDEVEELFDNLKGKAA